MRLTYRWLVIGLVLVATCGCDDDKSSVTDSYNTVNEAEKSDSSSGGDADQGEQNDNDQNDGNGNGGNGGGNDNEPPTVEYMVTLANYSSYTVSFKVTTSEGTTVYNVPPNSNPITVPYTGSVTVSSLYLDNRSWNEGNHHITAVNGNAPGIPDFNTDTV